MSLCLCEYRLFCKPDEGIEILRSQHLPHIFPRFSASGERRIDHRLTPLLFSKLLDFALPGVEPGVTFYYKSITKQIGPFLFLTKYLSNSLCDGLLELGSARKCIHTSISHSQRYHKSWPQHTSAKVKGSLRKSDFWMLV